MTERRRFLVTAGGALVTAAAVPIVNAPNVLAQPQVEWRMSTTWTPALDTLQGAATNVVERLHDLAAGEHLDPEPSAAHRVRDSRCACRVSAARSSRRREAQSCSSRPGKYKPRWSGA